MFRDRHGSNRTYTARDFRCRSFRFPRPSSCWRRCYCRRVCVSETTIFVRLLPVLTPLELFRLFFLKNKECSNAHIAGTVAFSYVYCIVSFRKNVFLHKRKNSWEICRPPCRRSEKFTLYAISHSRIRGRVFFLFAAVETTSDEREGEKTSTTINSVVYRV